MQAYTHFRKRLNVAGAAMLFVAWTAGPAGADTVLSSDFSGVLRDNASNTASGFA